MSQNENNSSLQNLIWNLLRGMVFLAGAFFSYRWIAERWIVGPIFGAVVVFWHWSCARSVSVWTYLNFMIISTLTYNLVILLSGVQGPGNFLPEYLDLGVITGTILLPLAAHFLFNASWRPVLLSMPVIYLVTLAAGMGLGQINIPAPADSFIHAASVWQLAYLLILIRPKKIQG